MARRSNYRQIGGPTGHLARLEELEGNSMSARWFDAFGDSYLPGLQLWHRDCQLVAGLRVRERWALERDDQPTPEPLPCLAGSQESHGRGSRNGMGLALAPSYQYPVGISGAGMSELEEG